MLATNQQLGTIMRRTKHTRLSMLRQQIADRIEEKGANNFRFHLSAAPSVCSTSQLISCQLAKNNIKFVFLKEGNLWADYYIDQPKVCVAESV